jgi:uncharacterized protein HemY
VVTEYSQREGWQPMDLEDEAEKAEENGDLETARTLWKEIAARNQDATSFVSYGRLAMSTEEWDAAEAAFYQALGIASYTVT